MVSANHALGNQPLADKTPHSYNFKIMQGSTYIFKTKHSKGIRTGGAGIDNSSSQQSFFTLTFNVLGHDQRALLLVRL